MHRGLVLFIGLFIVGLAGCDLGTEPEEGNGDENGEVSFAEDVQPIFTENCASAGCHGTSNTQRNLVLVSGQASENIVNVPSEWMPEMDRIEPGKPDSSFLLLKVKPNPPQGSRMPLGGSPLTDGQIEMIESWIEAGAENN